MAKPVLDLATVYTAPPAPVNVPFKDQASGSAIININTTTVTDGVNTGLLADVLKISTEKKVTLSSDALVSDGTNEAKFDFKYDTDGEVFGAGTAFLKD